MVPSPTTGMHAPPVHSNWPTGHRATQKPFEHTSVAVQVMMAGHVGVQTPFTHW